MQTKLPPETRHTPSKNPNKLEEKDYLDHLIEDALATRPGFADLWASHALIGEMVAERSRLGLSQAEIAERMGVGRVAVTKLELNPGGVSLDRVLSYARALGVEMQLKRSQAKPKDSPSRKGRPAKPKASDKPEKGNRSKSASGLVSMAAKGKIG